MVKSRDVYAYAGYLKGEASAIYDELTDAQKIDWGLLTDEMAQKLGSGDSTHGYRRQMQARKQRDNESYAEFGQALLELADKAYPDGQGCTADMRKNIVLDIFLNGTKICIREHLRRRARPASLADAIAAAMEEEELFNELNREKLTTEQISLINNINNVQRQFPQNNWPNNSQYFGNGFNTSRPLNSGWRGAPNWPGRGGNVRVRFNWVPGGNRNRGGYQYAGPNNRGNFNNFNRGNVDNNRRFPTRRRGQGGYKINMVSSKEIKENGFGKEGEEKDRSVSGVGQTLLPFLTIIALSFLICSTS